MTGRHAPNALPPLWADERKRHLRRLVLAGCGQAACTGTGAIAVHIATRPLAWLVVCLLVAAAVGFGLLRRTERVLAERLSQHYVHEIRIGLLRRNLTTGEVRSLGVAVARTTNDLTAVKNWVALGIAPLCIGVPLIVGALGILAVLDPLLAVALAVPLALLAATLVAVTPATYAKSRDLRRVRGRLSALIADTVLAIPAIRSAGGGPRELGRVERTSTRLADTAVERARYAGTLRGAAAAASGLATASTVGVGLFSGAPASTMAGALIVVGFLTGPIQDMGRVVEYRQAYRAARRIVGPAFQAATQTARSRPSPAPRGDAVTADGVEGMPALTALPGDRVLLDVDDRRVAGAVLGRFAGLGGGPGRITVAGHDVDTAGHKVLRRLVGYAAQGMQLPRGTVTRTVLYRCPGGSRSKADKMIDAVGMTERVAGLPKGAGTTLRHGGEPLTIPERARLLLARALLDEPPLIVLDHIDTDLDAAGTAVLRTLLQSYPGVVVFTSDQPDAVAENHVRWAAHVAPQPH